MASYTIMQSLQLSTQNLPALETQKAHENEDKSHLQSYFSLIRHTKMKSLYLVPKARLEFTSDT